METEKRNKNSDALLGLTLLVIFLVGIIASFWGLWLIIEWIYNWIINIL